MKSMKAQETLAGLSKLGAEDQHPSSIPYAWQFSGEQPGPSVTVLGAVHGNEVLGVDIVKQLMLSSMQNGVKAGTLNLAIGNPRAYVANSRGTEADLNRCFGKNPPPSYEAQRAEELKQLLANTDLLLDLHATIKPSQPFLVIANLQHKLAHCLPQLGLDLALTGKGLYAADGEAICTDTFTASHGGLGVTIEAGWLEDPQTAKISEGVYAALISLGLFVADAAKPVNLQAETKIEILDCYQAVPAGAEFQFIQDWKNFQTIAAGETLATEGGLTLSPREDSLVIFPKNGPLQPGPIACLLAKKQAA